MNESGLEKIVCEMNKMQSLSNQIGHLAVGHKWNPQRLEWSCFVMRAALGTAVVWGLSDDDKLTHFREVFLLKCRNPPQCIYFLLPRACVLLQFLPNSLFFICLLSSGAEDVHAPEPRRADQERSAEGDLWKRWAGVSESQTTRQCGEEGLPRTLL